MSRKKGTTTTTAAAGGTSKRRASEAKGKAVAAAAEVETEGGSDEREVQATRSSSEAKRLEEVIPQVVVALLEEHPELPAKDAVLGGFGDYYRGCIERRAGPRVPPPATAPADEPMSESEPEHGHGEAMHGLAERGSGLEEAHPTSTFSFDDAPPAPAPAQSDLFAVLAGEAEHATSGGSGSPFAFSSETESIIVSDDDAPPATDAQTAGTLIVPAEALFGDAETGAAEEATSALQAFDDAPAEGATSMMPAFELPDDEPQAAPSEATVVVQAMPDEPEADGEPENRGAKKSKKASRKKKA